MAKKKTRDTELLDELSEDVETFLFDNLSDAVSEDYLDAVVENLKPGVIDDVIECSGFETEGIWNDDDIKLALGRVLVAKLHIDC